MDLDEIITNSFLFDQASRVGQSGHEKIQHSFTAEISSSENTSSKTVIQDGKIIVEVYDKGGQLIKKTPPGYLPFDEIA